MVRFSCIESSEQGFGIVKVTTELPVLSVVMSNSDDGTCARTSSAAAGDVLWTAECDALETVCGAPRLAYNDDALGEICEVALFADGEDAKEAPHAT